MHLRSLVLALTLSAAAAQAQQSMPDMPGMTMPPTQAPAKPKPKPNRTPQAPDPQAPDLHQMSRDGNPAAQTAGQSEQQSIQQQSTPANPSDPTSLAVPIQQIQEPEALTFHTGADLPAPELLLGLSTRTPMTLDQFLTLAQANPSLAETRSAVARSDAQARQASLPPDPTFGYSGDHIRGGQYHGGEQGAFVAQDLVLGRKLALRRDVFRAEASANQQSVSVQQERIRHDVSAAFFDTLADQSAVTVEDRLLNVALDAETNAHELERVGQADASDILEAEVAAEQAKLDFVQAQRHFLSSFGRLRSLSAQPTLAPTPLTGPLTEPPALNPESLIDQDVQQSPAVLQAQAEVATAEARLKAAQRERVPNLNLKAGEWYSGEPLEGSGRRAGPETFVEAGVQLPLWNRNQGNIQAAEVLVDRARQEVTRVQLQTRSRAEPYAQQYQTARFAADRYRTQMIPRARRAYQLQVTKYQQMAQPYPRVLAAQRMLFTLQLSYLKSLQDQWRAALALQHFTLSDALDQPMTAGDNTTMQNTPTNP